MLTVCFARQRSFINSELIRKIRSYCETLVNQATYFLRNLSDLYYQVTISTVRIKMLQLAYKNYIHYNNSVQHSTDILLTIDNKIEL